MLFPFVIGARLKQISVNSFSLLAARCSFIRKYRKIITIVLNSTKGSMNPQLIEESVDVRLTRKLKFYFKKIHYSIIDKMISYIDHYSSRVNLGTKVALWLHAAKLNAQLNRLKHFAFERKCKQTSVNHAALKIFLILCEVFARLWFTMTLVWNFCKTDSKI